MNEKEKYLELMQRYFDAETSPEQEKELALYAASTVDPAFEPLRAVLGYLSVGRQKKARKRRAVRFYAVAAAASVVLVAALGFSLGYGDRRTIEEDCIRYTYGVKVEDDALIMASVETSLADFFGGVSPAEANIREIFER